MRFQENKSKNGYSSFFIVKSVFVDGHRTNKVIEKLGTYEDLKVRAGKEDPILWGQKYAKELTLKEKESNEEVIVKFSPNKILDKDCRNTFNCGYLYLQKIYYDLGLNKISRKIKEKYKFEFDLNDILSKLIYARILSPSSKKSTYEYSKTLIEQPKFDLHQIYRALEVLSKESDFIQTEIYKNSKKIYERKKDVIYYDCTNFFFETEQSEGIKQYGYSKEHRPNPIVEMGMFMDSDGIPLAITIVPGNTNEQITLKPLEKKIIRDFEMSDVIVCTDAGLSSRDNRIFNAVTNRDFITTQSIKKLNNTLKKWCLSKQGWKLSGSKKIYDLNEILNNPQKREKYKESIFYKDQWEVDDKGFEQRYIVSFSIKYMNYLKTLRNNHIEKAKVSIDKNNNIDHKRQTDYKRLIKKVSVTDSGEVADESILCLDEKLISEEEKYDGFYCVCTSLEDDVTKILKANKNRWEIEENFRILKTDFKSRPVYLKTDDRIQAHFLSCFLSLILFRILEKKILFEEFTVSTIIKEMRNMNLLKIPGEGYIPTYTRTDFTDALHKAFPLRTDYRIIKNSTMRNIIKLSKKS